MNAGSAHAESMDPLRVLGQVEPPSSRALDAARELLWSAVADEMLRSAPTGDAASAAAAADGPREQARRRLWGQRGL